MVERLFYDRYISSGFELIQRDYGAASVSIHFMLYSSVYRISPQALKSPVVQQKVGACSLGVLATRWMSAMP